MSRSILLALFPVLATGCFLASETTREEREDARRLREEQEERVALIEARLEELETDSLRQSDPEEWQAEVDRVEENLRSARSDLRAAHELETEASQEVVESAGRNLGDLLDAGIGILAAAMGIPLVGAATRKVT